MTSQDMTSYSMTSSQYLTSSSSSCSLPSEDNSRNSTEDSENAVALDSEIEAEGQKRKHSDDSLVQIRASTAEVRRRIAAFIGSKRMEVSDNNVREFCFDLPSTEDGSSEEYNSCARVDSVFVSRVGGCSHVRITRVHNTHGPQTQTSHADNGRQHAGDSNPSLFKTSVEERLRNVEEHMNITSDNKTDLFSRLKAVEEGILFLSGISPEYFEHGKLPQPKVKRKRVYQPASEPEAVSPTKLKTDFDNISDIDQRILALRTKLQDKSKQLPSPDTVCVTAPPRQFLPP